MAHEQAATVAHDRSHVRRSSSRNNSTTVAPCNKHRLDHCSRSPLRNFVQHRPCINQLCKGARLVEHRPEHLARRRKSQWLRHLGRQHQHTVEQPAPERSRRPHNQNIGGEALNHGVPVGEVSVEGGSARSNRGCGDRPDSAQRSHAHNANGPDSQKSPPATRVVGCSFEPA